MKTERDKALGLIIASIDAALFVLAFCAAYWVRAWLPEQFLSDSPSILPLRAYIWLLWLAIPIYGLLLYRRGEYTGVLEHAWHVRLFHLIRPFIMGSLVLGTAIFFLQAKNFSRPLFCLFVVFSAVTIAASRLVIYGVLRTSIVRWRISRYVLIVGTNETALRLAADLAASPGLALVRVGHLTEQTEPPDSVRVLGKLEDAADVLARTVVDDVFIALPRPQLDKAHDVIRACEEQGITVHVHLDFARGFIGRPQFSMVKGIPTLSLSSTRHEALDLILKRVFDVTGAGLGLVCMSPIMLIAAIAIRLTSGRPIIYRQIRKGFNGREFTLYKFRTMVLNAHLRKLELLDRNEMSGPVFKLANDPRVTPVGRMLRRYSIDELPQLWNVLVGDMSLVGPRPPLPDEVVKYQPRYRKRLRVKPGITCLWQVSGRNNVDFDRWMELDHAYIRNWSLALDLMILLKTIPAVLLAKGAR